MTCKLEQHENCLVERIERQERRIEEQRGEIEELKRMVLCFLFGRLFRVFGFGGLPCDWVLILILFHSFIVYSFLF